MPHSQWKIENYLPVVGIFSLESQEVMPVNRLPQINLLMSPWSGKAVSKDFTQRLLWDPSDPCKIYFATQIAYRKCRFLIKRYHSPQDML